MVNIYFYWRRIIKSDTNNIYYLQEYIPYSHENRREEFYKLEGGLVLDLKDNKDSGINHFKRKLVSDDLFKKIINDIDVIFVVPSSDKDKKETGIKTLAKKLSEHFKKDFYRNGLIRQTSIPKAAHGGPRDINIHYKSIKLDENLKETISKKKCIIIDDITTSGASMLACAAILYENEVSKVYCVAIAKTI